MRRTATISLHWANLLLLIRLVAAGPVAALAWLFVVTSATMAAIALGAGLMNGPGPKLEGAVRAAHPWLSRGMYLLLAGTGLATLAYLLGLAPTLDLPTIYFFLLSVVSLHAIFHLWRHTALGDGALRRILPQAMDKML